MVAISFDDVATSKKVAETLEITFPMLSDVGSHVIDAYGIRNLEAAGSPKDGIPYPTTFLIASDGKVKALLAHDGHRERHGGADILKAIRDTLEKESEMAAEKPPATE